MISQAEKIAVQFGIKIYDVAKWNFYRENEWRKNDAKWYSQILWNCFRIQFRPVHIRGSIPKTRVCFVTPPTFKSSVLTLRHVTNFDISVRERREKGVEKPAGLCLWEHSEEKWLVMVLTRFCGCRGGVFDLSPFLLPPSPFIYIYLYVYHSSSRFLFPSSTRFPPYKYTLRLIPSISFLLSSTISSLRRTNLPLFLFHLFPSYSPSPLFIPLLLYLRIIYPSHSQFLLWNRESVWNRGSFSVSLSLSPSLIPTERNVGVERGWLVAQGCQTPSHATTKLPLKGDPAMAAGLVVFRFRGELHSLLPSRFPVPTPPGSRRRGGGRKWNWASRSEAESEWLESTGTRWRSRKWRCATRKGGGGWCGVEEEGDLRRKRDKARVHIARKQQPPFILLHYHTN